MPKEDLILVGGGGHCQSIIDVIEEQDKYKIIGILDSKNNNNLKSGYDFIGTDSDLPKLSKLVKNFFLSIGQINSSSTREILFRKLQSLHVTIPVIVSPKSHVSKYAQISLGSIVMHNVLVNAGATIKENCIINTGCIIEHDVLINAHCHVSTGAIINGNTTIGVGSFIGSNATIIQGVHVEKYNIIGAGTVLLKDTIPNATYVGNPGRILDKK